MLPVSCMRQGMLTKGPMLDPKCKLNISSFVTLPHLLDCLICTRNFVSIVLLLGMLGGGLDRWGVVDSYQCVGGATGGGYYHTIFLFLLFSFGLSYRVSFLSEYSMIAVVSVSLFFICFVCLWSL